MSGKRIRLLGKIRESQAKVGKDKKPIYRETMDQIKKRWKQTPTNKRIKDWK